MGVVVNKNGGGDVNKRQQGGERCCIISMTCYFLLLSFACLLGLVGLGKRVRAVGGECDRTRSCGGVD